MLTANLTTFHIRSEMERNRRCERANIAVFPVGSIEQRGPKLPLNTDTVIAEAVVWEIDRREDGRLFVCPAIQYTHADSGMDFAGGLSAYPSRLFGKLSTDW